MQRYASETIETKKVSKVYNFLTLERLWGCASDRSLDTVTILTGTDDNRYRILAIFTKKLDPAHGILHQPV